VIEKTKIKSKKSITKMTVSAVFLALSIVLSFIVIYRMPYGGDITAVSTLPVAFISIKYGLKQGLATAFLFSVFQFFSGFFALTSYLHTFKALVICTLFDYILPFTIIGFAGIFRKKGYWGYIFGIFTVMFVRFFCHFISGVTIWTQFAPEGTSGFMYSLIYNGGYIGVEILTTITVAGILFKLPQLKKFLQN
jgi:thiamine transporter